MDQALRIFLEDYVVWLSATKKEYNDAKALLSATKQLVESQGKSMSSMIALRHKIDKLFQTNYVLMESHLRLHNVYSWYSDEEKNLIDEYETVNKKVGNLIKEISNFIKSYLNVEEAQTSADAEL